MAYKRQSPMPIIEGGTNASTFATVDGTIYYDGTRLVDTATGTAGQVLTSNGAGVAPSYKNSTGGSSISIIGAGCQNQISPNRSLSTTTGTQWFAMFGFSNNGVSVKAQNEIPTPIAGTISNMYAYIVDNTSTSNVSITLNVNGSNTAVTTTVTALTTGSFTDLVHSVAVNVGDLIQLEVQQSTTGNIYGTVVFQFLS